MTQQATLKYLWPNKDNFFMIANYLTSDIVTNSSLNSFKSAVQIIIFMTSDLHFIINVIIISINILFVHYCMQLNRCTGFPASTLNTIIIIIIYIIIKPLLILLNLCFSSGSFSDGMQVGESLPSPIIYIYIYISAQLKVFKIPNNGQFFFLLTLSHQRPTQKARPVKVGNYN